MILKKETVEALRGPLGYYGPGAKQRWKRFTIMVEIAFLRALTSDKSELEIIDRRFQRLAYYGSMETYEVAKLLVDDILPHLQPDTQQRLQYLNEVLLPWLERVRVEAYDTVLTNLRKDSSARHSQRMQAYQKRRKQAIAQGLKPGTVEWQALFRPGKVISERPRDPAGHRRWSERRSKFYGSPAAKDAELVALWETVWHAVTTAGFALP